jgi:hypothetical protein
MSFCRATLVAMAAFVALSGQIVARAADSTAPELAAALQRKYDGIKDFSADFTHAYEGGVLRKQITERGHLLVKKPGKMRWDYAEPEPKQFVSDGLKMYSYIPQDTVSRRCTGWDAGGEPGVEVGPEVEATGLRLAGAGARPRHARDPRVAHGRRARRKIELFFHEFEGKPRSGR